eukprot:CAMPEP_0206044478 /NCGR_PEP_ID=MMETSP1466-20131121/12688_1 /ASSEMBLY_ACC=CAM_ASM_001126 /TAXON_ID=44452 /ORGANISM="Pavlova gyrans, Strain CCMP608" /LENGTH=109 /DNA_ID=CAMNT_0053419371 /DNA_START=141 /DNA_END=468 /DNA_ORIENTATION=-
MPRTATDHRDHHRVPECDRTVGESQTMLDVIGVGRRRSADRAAATAAETSRRMPANGDSESMAIVVFDGVNIQTLCQAPLCLSREPRCNLAEGLAVCEGHPLLELRWLA